MKRITSFVINILFIIYLLTTACSDSERRIGLLGQTSTVIINLGAPSEQTSTRYSIIEQIFRFFTRDAIAQVAPASLSYIKVRIAGSDIGLIEKEFNPYGAITLNVPAGNQRQFEVIAYVAPGDPTAAASFRGTAIANLPAGETVTIPIAMNLYETKILIPDFIRNRLVVINSMSGYGWTVKTGTQLGLGSTIYPYDIDFDNRGRIYILNRLSAGFSQIIRIDDLNGKNPTTISTSLSSANALAVDKSSDRIYAANNFQLSVLTHDGVQIDASAAITDIWNIHGMDVASNGTLYIAGQYLGNEAIINYNPQTQNVVTYPGTSNPVVRTIAPLSIAWDVVVKSPSVYITQKESASTSGTNAIRRYTMDLNPTYSELLRNPFNASDTLRGPSRFVAVNNTDLFVLDEDMFDGATYDYLERIIHFNTIEGLGWLTFTPDPAQGQSYFGFFNTL